MVTIITSNKKVMMNNTNKEIEYIKTNPRNQDRTSTIRVKQQDEESEPLFIDSLDSSEDEISGDESDDMEQQEEGQGKEKLMGMPEDQDDSNPEIMRISNHALPSHSTGRTVKQEDQDLDIQNAEDWDQVDADFNNIALTELGGANDPDVQAQKEDLTDNVDVDWWVTVLVRVVAVRAVELLSELSHCQSCCQSYCQSCCQSCCQISAAVRAVVKAVVRAQPAVRAAVRMLNESNFYSQVSGAVG